MILKTGIKNSFIFKIKSLRSFSALSDKKMVKLYKRGLFSICKINLC
jgi:hypothetical protein